MLQMKLTDDSWYVLRNTTGVTGFVGSGTGSKTNSSEEKKLNVYYVRAVQKCQDLKIDSAKDDPVKVIFRTFR